MEVSEGAIWTVGIFAQVCFASRQITQWWASERAKSIQSPSSFWLLSLIGCSFFLLYGLFRYDLAIIIGSFLNFYICCRNLYFKGIWSRWPSLIRYLILMLPIVILGYIYLFYPATINSTLHNNAINNGLMIVGTFGYLLFTFRFVYQWYLSEKMQLSFLPVGFFVLSIIGSLLIIFYGIYRNDLILIVSYSGGLIVYLRNIYINYYMDPDNDGVQAE